MEVMMTEDPLLQYMSYPGVPNCVTKVRLCYCQYVESDLYLQVFMIRRCLMAINVVMIYHSLNDT